MVPRKRLLRVLDANINRAREGLRVCEDVTRFCFNATADFRRLRRLRAALSAQVRRLPVTQLQMIRFRDSREDPGRTARASSIKSVEHLLLINLQRTKDALRVLEETSRLLAPRCVAGFQQLRFRTYDVERDLLLRLAAVRHHRQSRRRTS